MKSPAESYAALLADMVRFVAPMLEQLLGARRMFAALRADGDPYPELHATHGAMAAAVRAAEEVFLEGLPNLRDAAAAASVVGYAFPPIHWPAIIEDTSQALELLMHPDFPESSVAQLLAQLDQLVDGPLTVHVVGERPHRLATAALPAIEA